jgi:hypothetical protein
MTDIVNGNYEKLAVLLRGREDWRPEEQDGERFWCFGVAGAARVVIIPEMDGFLMYRADEDRSWVIPRIALPRFCGGWVFLCLLILPFL